MAFKDILAYLDATAASEVRLRVATEIAKTHAARLVGVDASTDDAFLGEWGKSAAEIGSRFDEALRKADLVGRFAGADDPDHAPCVDLIIAPRPEGETRKLVRPDIPDELMSRPCARYATRRRCCDARTTWSSPAFPPGKMSIFAPPPNCCAPICYSMT